MSLILWLLGFAEAAELTFAVDAGYVGSDVVMGGFGASAGLRLPITHHLSAYGDVGGRLFLPASAEVSLGLLAW